jgi:acetyltransferase
VTPGAPASEPEQPLPQGYPQHLVEHWRLPDATPVEIRPIRPSDLALETEFVRTLSPQSGYQRLMSSRHPQADELWRYTHIDYDRELALVACASIDGVDRQLAVARYVRDASGDHAAFAIVVGDAWQGCGLASQLMRSLIRAARDCGVRRLNDFTMSTNVAMLKLARKLGFTLQRDPLDATITRLSLDL